MSHGVPIKEFAQKKGGIRNVCTRYSTTNNTNTMYNVQYTNTIPKVFCALPILTWILSLRFYEYGSTEAQ